MYVSTVLPDELAACMLALPARQYDLVKYMHMQSSAGNTGFESAWMVRQPWKCVASSWHVKWTALPTHTYKHTHAEYGGGAAVRGADPVRQPALDSEQLWSTWSRRNRAPSRPCCSG
eukprot:303487-Pelagomonas_calceolata.AAC.4